MDHMTEHTEVPLLQRPFRMPKGAKTLDIEMYLVIFTRAIMEDHNTSTYDVLRAHCHPDFKLVDFTVNECGLSQAKSLEEHISNTEALKRVHPNWQANPFNFSVAMYGNSDRAIVWCTSPGSDVPGDWITNRESVHRIHWRRRKEDGVWEVYMHSGLRGPGSLFLQSNDSEKELKDVPVCFANPMELYSENELRR